MNECLAYVREQGLNKVRNTNEGLCNNEAHQLLLTCDPSTDTLVERVLAEGSFSLFSFLIQIDRSLSLTLN